METVDDSRLIILCFDGFSPEVPSSEESSSGDSSSEDSPPNAPPPNVPSPKVSNIQRIYDALDHNNAGKQMVYYQPMAGASDVPPAFRFFDKMKAKAAALKLEPSSAWFSDDYIMDAYRFTFENFNPGDHVCILGFGRGGYIACSVAGLLLSAGLPQGISDLEDEYLLYKQRFYSEENKDRVNLRRRTRKPRTVVVDFLGIWEGMSGYGMGGNALPFERHLHKVAAYREAKGLDEPISNDDLQITSPGDTPFKRTTEQPNENLDDRESATVPARTQGRLKLQGWLAKALQKRSPSKRSDEATTRSLPAADRRSSTPKSNAQPPPDNSAVIWFAGDDDAIAIGEEGGYDPAVPSLLWMVQCLDDAIPTIRWSSTAFENFPTVDLCMTRTETAPDLKPKRRPLQPKEVDYEEVKLSLLKDLKGLPKEYQDAFRRKMFRGAKRRSVPVPTRLHRSVQLIMEQDPPYKPSANYDDTKIIYYDGNTASVWDKPDLTTTGTPVATAAEAETSEAGKLQLVKPGLAEEGESKDGRLKNDVARTDNK